MDKVESKDGQVNTPKWVPEIIWEDEDFVALNKPAGMLTIPDRFNAQIPCLLTWLQSRYASVFPVHRLDRYTSGVVLFAKNEEAQRTMSALFQERDIRKKYLAIAEGRFSAMEGLIDQPLAESTTIRGKMLVHKRGKESKTHFTVLRQFQRFALVSLDLLTGRMHQIRVHLQFIGHPLAVDVLYGSRAQLFVSELKGKKFQLGKYTEEKPLLQRQPLHAESIHFIHPTTGQEMSITAPMPKDMRAVLNQLEKWDS